MTTDWMIAKLKDTSDIELDEEIKICYIAVRLLQSGQSTQDSQLRLMFNLYNKYYRTHESGLFCASCRTRIAKGLQNLLPILEEDNYMRQNGE